MKDAIGDVINFMLAVPFYIAIIAIFGGICYGIYIIGNTIITELPSPWNWIGIICYMYLIILFVLGCIHGSLEN